MPLSNLILDENVAWFDVGAASAAFLAECGPGIVLISIEVAKYESRYVEALFEIDSLEGIFKVGCPIPSKTIMMERVIMLATHAAHMRRYAEASRNARRTS